ncbi:Gfo/Idh/MocA family oxidoreductase [Paenibacillus cremeus]|uniref:Gfo/Idh/MocA family oxidoreductase n=2 Tax=Paenibacillus cremeus TaxID=2163881 RepID=A0A559K063_9BACL|nr:Gfo/Idh/MocA family oxidoreductase [Paenibacillus cremeus]
MFELGYMCKGIYEADEPSLAQALSEKFSIPIVSDLEAMLKSNVSIVGSSAINNEKIDVIEKCEEYGKHIMLDKPIVTSRQGLNRLEAVFNRGKIQVGMQLTSRERKSIVTLKQKIDKGYLGDIVSITMRKPHRLSPAKRHPWHFSKEQNGGIIVDLLIHDFDLLRWLTGKEVRRINSCMAKNILPEYPQFYDTATAGVLMEGNVLAQLYTDWHTPDTCWAFGDCRIFVSGTKGSAELRLFGDPSVEMEELMFCMTGEDHFHRVELITPAVSVVEDFLLRIQGKPSSISHEDLFSASKAAIEADEQAVLLN